MKNSKFFITIFFLALARLKNATNLIYPQVDFIAMYKPTSISPIGSVCGLEYRDTLCDNRFSDKQSCSNSSLIFYCDQTCPFGNVIQQLNQLEQLKLENMNPCVIFKDFGYLISSHTRSKNSYYFDKTNNLCSLSNKVAQWKPFSVQFSKANPELSFSNPRTSDALILDSGFSVSLWFTQTGSNNGTLINVIQDDNSTVLSLTVETRTKKIYISYICYTKSVLYPHKEIKNMCNLELNAFKLNLRENFIAFRIYKMNMDLFVNEPDDFNGNLSFSSIGLSYDLGGYFVNNSNKFNFFVGTDLEEKTKFYGWIQDFQVYTISLVNIEIANLYGKLKQTIKIQPECRCPNDYPRNTNENSTNCLKNKFSKIDLLDTVSRLNENAHPLSFINDDNFRTSWISCILTITNPIEIILDLENGIYLIQRVEIFFSNLPPTNLLLERYYDNKWIRMQKYSVECDGSDSNCFQLPADFINDFFGGYTIVWSKVIDNEDLYFSNTTLVEEIKASKIKLILSGYYPSVKNDIRKLYYSISELRIKGRCDCNGYSSTCDMSLIPFKCGCDSNSNTYGDMCQECQPAYNNKKYETRYSNPFASCEKCNCNNRSDTCDYDENLNQGVCKNCINDSTGLNCEKCVSSYFFNQETNQCERCQCNTNGVITGSLNISYCDQVTGRCFCKQNVEGDNCDKCKPGYYNFSGQNPLGCKACECNPESTIGVNGTSLTLCDDKTGQCNCITQFVSGIKCDRCLESTFDLSKGCTRQCNCDPIGSISASCDQTTGQCNCKNKVRGLKCNQCELGYYNFSTAGCSSKCQCDPVGSFDVNLCDSLTGNCLCRTGYTGRNCDRCMSGYWRSNSQCIKCQCNLNGILDPNNICEEDSGKCICNSFSEGFACDMCKPGFYGLTNNTETCKQCECDPIGTNENSLVDGNYICDSKTSQCVCNKNRIGIKCESCAVGFFFLGLTGFDCFECACDPSGSIPGSNCDSLTGECVCKIANGIGGTRCDQCLDGYYNFSRSTGSCSVCGCNIAGSYDQICDQSSGQCNCKEFVTGPKCSVCIPGTSNLDINNPYGCSKSPSKQSPPFLSVKNSNTITVTWVPPDYPNGIIRYYLLYRNETLVTNTSRLIYDDTNLEPFIVYSYRIESFNDEGNTSSRLQHIAIALPSQPCCRFTYRLFNIRSSQVEIIWTIPERLNGLNLLYFIRVYYRIDRSKQVNTTTLENLREQVNSSLMLEHNSLKPFNINFLQARISRLSSYTTFYVNIKACNRDLNNMSILYCLEGIPETNSSTSNNYTIFITSQDRPEQQTEPVVITINSSFVIVGVRRPLRPNGIILLYEIWKRNYNNSDREPSLACAIEDLYDPNDLTQSSDNRLKICMIRNLSPRSTYGLVATSSTIIGRSQPSTELIFTTIENPPVCPPVVQSKVSYKFDSLSISWLPSYNQTLFETYWINCLGGGVRNFSLYRVNELKLTLIYTGLENTVNLSRLNYSQRYDFVVELCNLAGCSKTEVFSARTLDPPPNKWNIDDLKYEFVKSGIKFDWSRYIPYDQTNDTQIKYKLERAKISFSNPPTLLESGYRFHGFNYYKFPSDIYYPQGYPYFGLRYFYKTKRDGLLYFAASSYSQSELSAAQIYQDKNWFLSNTQLQSEQCSAYLQGQKNMSDWNSVKIFRLNSYVAMRSNEEFTQVNSSQCNNQVITDLTGVFVGGLPDNFLSRDESSFSRQEFKKIQKNRFYGCIKNISTIIEFDTIKYNLNSSVPISREIEFNFSEALLSPGEPYNSNTIYGCPLNLDTESNPVHILGFGFLYSNVRETMPAQLQTGRNFNLNIQFRTEWSNGILYFNYDMDNEQYLLLRLHESNRIEVSLKTRIRYDLTNQKAFLNYFDLLFNETYGINSITNGYWSTLNLDIDFANRTLLIQINQTRIVYKNFFTNSSVPSNFDTKILDASLLFTFYFNSQSFYGGFELQMLNDIYELLNQPYINSLTKKYFFGLFNFIESLEDKIYFTGCIKQVRINGFLIDFFNVNNRIEYKNVRFDGCPSVIVFFENVTPLSETLAETSDTIGYDNNFWKFTEYFYRVTAFNTQGKSSSEWTLIRTPDDQPEGLIDINKYLNVQAISGYKIQVNNIKNFCFYCENLSFNVNGVVNRFVFKITGSNLTQDYIFYCNAICFNDQPVDQFGFLSSVFKKTEDPRSKEFFIDTKPITTYSIIVSVCNPAGCIDSDVYNITTLGEIPDGVSAPVLINSSSNSISLEWTAPKYPSGNITAFIIRLIDGQNENVIYFGLQTKLLVSNLRPLINYTFLLEACNIIGCGRSLPVSYSTGEMAPLSVQQPTILKITQTVIIVKWNKPNNDQIQYGFLTNYILYLNDKDFFINVTSFNISTCAECSSNIKDLNNLIPGAEYEIVLAACTNGGCTNSSELKVRTFESDPDTSDIKIELVNRTSSYMHIVWNKPSRPNGLLNKYVLFLNDKVVYEGNRTEFFIDGLLPNTLYFFVVRFCNFYSCNSTGPVRFSTDEAIPEGSIILDAQAKGSNNIEMKWSSNQENPLKPNGHIMFSVFVTGPFLVTTKTDDLLELYKNNSEIIQKKTLNLLNTTIFNTKYGILDRILPYSLYIIQVNASNSKGFLLSNQVEIETFKSYPELVIPPQLAYTNSTCLKIEWFDPLLINSEDRIIFYQLVYRRKHVWNRTGPIVDPVYDSEVITLFSNKILANFYVLGNLTPFTAYSFQLTASNSYGESKSEWSKDFYTLESPPRVQPPPEVVNFTSVSVLIRFSQAEIPNGFIQLFKINVFKYTNELKHLGVISLKNTTKIYNVTHLEPFTKYLFTIESCNNNDCVQSFYDKFKPERNNYTQTLPAIPEFLRDPILTSPNSYSIEINWNPPDKMNGIIQSYVLERQDFRSLLKQNTIRKYKFTGSKLKFLDDTDLESCGVYTYRLFAYNQVGFTTSNFVNITVSPSRPLIVTPPVVNLINSSTVRFEWSRPLTLCNITKYVLTLIDDSKNTLRIDINSSEHMILIPKLSPFTVYRVTLTGCVSIISDSCSSSLTKTFRTPGYMPEGLSTPVVKLLSPKAVSVEWLEPELKNGQFLSYQVLRLNLKLNRTENLYSGQELYFLDMKTKNLQSYRYKVVYINEFGSSVSEWSSVIEIEEAEAIVLDDKIRYNFNLIFECPTANLGVLKWDLKTNEIVNFVKKLFNIKTILYRDFFYVLNENKYDLSNGLNMTEKLVHLNESTNYQVQLYLEIQTDTGHRYYLISENRSCVTPSLIETFGNTSIKFEKIDVSLKVTYELGSLVANYYKQFEFMLNKTNKYLDSKNISGTKGEVLMGPIDFDEVYFLILKACRDFICTRFDPLVYSVSTNPPQGLSDPSVTLDGPISVNLTWKPVQKPNGYFVNYLIYRRLTCIDEHKPITIDCPMDKICCGPNIFDPKPGHKCCANFFYVPVPDDKICCGSTDNNEIRFSIGVGNTCCNDIPFYDTSTQYCCNSVLSNEIFGIQRQCPNFPKETFCEDFKLVANITITSYLDKNLNSSTSYEYNICAENSFGQTCSISNYRIKTKVIKPENFTGLFYRILNDRSIYLFWQTPVYPNDISNFYILARNSIPIYQGPRLNFEDTGIKPYEIYYYSVVACNTAGCGNSNRVLLSTVYKPPSDFTFVRVTQTYFSNFTIEWKKPDNLVEKFVFLIHEVDLEIEIFFDFNSDKMNLKKSAKNFLTENQFKFSKDSLLNPESIYSLTIIDLKPNFNYSYQLIACNPNACGKSIFGNVKMDPYEIQDMSPPVVYALNESVVEVIWWGPEDLNGDLEYYKIFRNGQDVATLRPSKSHFYTFMDRNLRQNELYTYKVQVSNGVFKLDSEGSSIRTPSSSNFTKCNFQLSQVDNSIIFMNILRVNFTQVTSHFILLRYDNLEWKKLVDCLDKTLSFSIKIIVLSQEKNVQTIDFPYPITSNENFTEFRLRGLKPNTNYSIRLIISSNFPVIKSMVTEALFIKTLSDVPHGVFDPPFVITHNYSNFITIRWKDVSTDLYEILLTRSDCLNRQYINITLNKQDLNFFFDETNQLFVYKYLDDFKYQLNSVKVTGLNQYGLISSLETEFLTRGPKPSPVSDVRTIELYQTGIKIKFKNKNFYLSHFIISIQPMFDNIPNRTREIYIPVVTECKINNMYETVINGLEPFMMFNLTVKAVSFSNYESDVTEFLIINTLESTPELLKPLKFESNSESILFKFSDPEIINGVFRHFNLYNPVDLIFSGKNREYLLEGLEPFTNYTFNYEVCTTQGCTRLKNNIVIQTSEDYPQGSEIPGIKKLGECFEIMVKNPKKLNGVYNRTEVYRLSRYFSLDKFIEEILIKNSSMLTVFRDCEVRPNILYSYRSVVYNNVGSLSSEYTDPLPIDLLKPDGFEQVNVTQINETVVVLIFQRPNKPYNELLTYKIYRDSELIFTLIENNLSLIEFYDSYNFLPDFFYKYNIFACNVIGCSTSENFSFFLRTKNVPPILVYRPILLDLGPNYAQIDASFSVILRESQKIIEYKYFLNDVLVVNSSSPIVKIRNLQPNTEFKINLEACTVSITACLKSRDYLVFKTLQEMPVLSFEPLCNYGIRDLLVQWPSVRQEIEHFVVKYRQKNNEYSNIIIDGDKYSILVDKLDPFTEYEVIVGGCNQAGCSYSKPSFCQTRKNLPQDITIQVKPLSDVSLSIKWSFSDEYKNEVYKYTLWRSVTNSPLSYDSNFRPMDKSLRLVYTGLEKTFIDQDIDFYTEYSYYVEILSAYGSSRSLTYKFRTRASDPQMFILIGSLRHVGNDSVSLMLRPPLKMNGALTNIYVVLRTDFVEDVKELIKTNIRGINETDLLDLLNNVTVKGLMSDTVYELKTKFCNQVSCMTSLQTIKFKTLPNEKIEFFDGSSPSPHLINFKWNFKKFDVSHKIRFQLRNTNLKANLVVYDGYENFFDFETAKPNTVYEFELLALDDNDVNWVIDRKALTVITQDVTKSLKSDGPFVNFMSFDNRSTLMELKWNNFVTQIDTQSNITYEITVNNIKIYTGTSKIHKQILTSDECIRLLNHTSELNIQLKAFVKPNIYLAEPIRVSFNCSLQQIEQKLEISKSFAFIFLIFLIMLLTLTTVIVFCCVNKYRSKKTIPSPLSSSVISINSSLQNIFMEKNKNFLNISETIYNSENLISSSHHGVLEKSQL